MSWNWSGYAGREIDQWKLDSFLGTRNGRGFFTSQGPGGGPVLVQAMSGGDPEAQAALASWERAKGLALENLLTVYACGEAELDGTQIAYGVMDLPEDELAEMLARGPVRNAEAFIAAIEKALADLHRDGLCHGAVTPSNVFVVRETPRLSVDTIRPCLESGRQRDLDELRSMAQAIRPAEAKAPMRRTDRARPFLEAAIVLGIVLLVAAYFLFGRHAGTKEVARRSEPTAQAPSMGEPAPSAPAHTPQPAEPSHTETADRVSPPPARRGGWAVIAATYDSFGAAEKRAESLRKRSAQLQPHVFPAQGEGKHYFVVLGSGLTQREAEQLRRQARSHGAPADTYVTKLDES